MVSRWFTLKPVQAAEEIYVVPPTVLASPIPPRGGGEDPLTSPAKKK